MSGRGPRLPEEGLEATVHARSALAGAAIGFRIRGVVRIPGLANPTVSGNSAVDPVPALDFGPGTEGASVHGTLPQLEGSLQPILTY